MHALNYRLKTRRNPILCTGAVSRLAWALVALTLLWSTLYWAIS